MNIAAMQRWTDILLGKNEGFEKPLRLTKIPVLTI